MRLRHAMQTQRHRSLHIGKTHDQLLEACCRGISSWWVRENPKLPSSHFIGIATNTSMVLNYAVVTYVMMTAAVGLPNAVYRHTQDQSYLMTQCHTRHTL